MCSEYITDAFSLVICCIKSHYNDTSSCQLPTKTCHRMNVQIHNCIVYCGSNTKFSKQLQFGWFLVHDEGDDIDKALNNMIGLKHVYSLPNLITKLP